MVRTVHSFQFRSPWSFVGMESSLLKLTKFPGSLWSWGSRDSNPNLDLFILFYRLHGFVLGPLFCRYFVVYWWHSLDASFDTNSYAQKYFPVHTHQ